MRILAEIQVLAVNSFKILLKINYSEEIIFYNIFVYYSNALSTKKNMIRRAVSDTSLISMGMVFEKNMLKKDGVHFENYILHMNLSKEEVEKLDQATISINGKLVIGNEPTVYDKYGVAKNIRHIYFVTWKIINQ